MNLYGFAGGDPLNFSDPFGLWPDLIGGQMAVAQNAALEDSRRMWMSMVMGSTSSLAAALAEAGEARAIGEASHHIVARGAARAAPARAVLGSVGVKINEAYQWREPTRGERLCG